jgi:RNA polymerase sigma-70 factor (ECF subfamily)
VWVEPYPDGSLAEGLAAPEARYEQRESVELAFVAALQHLPARQRAVLILRDVLGFSGAETADALEMSTKAVYSALQRAHATIDQHLPERAQQQTLRALGDERVREVVGRFVAAWDAGDVDAVVSMLAEDAILAMPPRPSWFRGLADARAFLARGPLAEGKRHVSRITHANGQVAVATRHAMPDGTGLDVLQLLELDEAGRIASITAFIDTDLTSFA